MSRIRELIKEKCPNGVAFFKLSDIGYIYNGLSGKTKGDFENGNCRYITYSNIYNNPSIKLDVNDYVSVKDSEQQNEIRFKDILVTGSSENLEDSGMISVVTEVPKGKIFLNSFCFGFRLNEKFYYKYNPNFLKHLLRNYDFRSKIISCSFGVTRYNLSKDKFLKIQIPLPPLEVQEDIARILDKFGKLEAELEAELEARKQQYEFWYNKLFNFQNSPMYSLIEVCNYIDYRGKTPKKEKNGIFLVTAKNIKNGYIDYHCSKEYISPNDFENVMRRGKVKKGDVLFTTEAPCGHVAQVDNEFIALAQRIIKYDSKDKSQLDNAYLKYVLLSKQFQNKLNNASNGSTVRGVKGSILHQLKIPVPLLGEQQKIINILDKFDKLVNDISEGLPAEIELRRKQYEYYRSKLLNFEELIINE